MAFFAPRFYHPRQPEPNFKGLFRLLDEFDQYSAQAPRRQTPVFTPRFDLRETESTYELHGELPGVDRENINIEFSDPQTIVIRGKVERSRTAGTPAAVESKADEEATGATADSDEPVVIEHEHASETSSVKSHQATVEDEAEEGTTTEVANTPATTVAETAKPAEPAQASKPDAPKPRYWVSERSVGQFARSFQFPTRVEHEAVSATLNNGVLTVSVPKAKKHESRRIAIN